MDYLNLALFCVAAIILLGSPGPAIAALIAVGRKNGFTGGLRFYGGLQVGLACAAAISAAGLFSVLQALPGVTAIMVIIATSYLVFLAYKIATSPVGQEISASSSGIEGTPISGFLLGITNPKAYVAFVSMMASYLIIPSNSTADAGLKWVICVVVMIIVDAIWLWLGDIIRRANMSAKAEKTMNIAMGATILVTAFLAYL